MYRLTSNNLTGSNASRSTSLSIYRLTVSTFFFEQLQFQLSYVPVYTFRYTHPPNPTFLLLLLLLLQSTFCGGGGGEGRNSFEREREIEWRAEQRSRGFIETPITSSLHYAALARFSPRLRISPTRSSFARNLSRYLLFSTSSSFIPQCPQFGLL